MVQKLLISVLALLFLAICYFTYEILNDSNLKNQTVSVKGSEVAAKLEASIPQYFDLIEGPVANLSADNLKEKIAAVRGNVGGNYSWLLNFYAASSNKDNEKISRTFTEFKKTVNSSSMTIIRAYNAFKETGDYNLASFFIHSAVQMVYAVSGADLTKSYPLINDNPTMYPVTVLQQILGVNDLLSDASLVTKLKSDKSITGTYDYDQMRDLSLLAVSKLLKAITNNELVNSEKKLNFFKESNTHTNNACWVALAYAATSNSNLKIEDISWYVNFIDTIKNNFHDIDETNIDLVQALLPCIQAASIDKSNWPAKLKAKLIETTLNFQFDSSERKICLGNDLILNIFPTSLSPNRDEICSNLKFNIADNVWMYLLLKNDEAEYKLKKALDNNW